MVKKLIISPSAFMVGALAVQTSGKDLNLSELYRNVARVFNSSHNLQAAFAAELRARVLPAEKLISIVGSLEAPTSCHLRLNDGPPIGASYFADMADSFILGALALHYSPLVQVSELRQLVERFWRFLVVKEQFYQHIDGLIDLGLLISHDLVADTDQKFVMLPGDAILLEELLVPR